MSTTLEDIKEMLIIINKNIEKTNEKLDLICNKMDEEIIEECKKMGSHINFVETVYDTVRMPLNYICNMINQTNNNNQICDNLPYNTKQIDNNNTDMS
jgi:hypothetical protein